MKSKHLSHLIGLTIGGAVCLQAHAASGQLVESIDYNQGVSLGLPGSAGNRFQFISGTTLPLVQTSNVQSNGESTQSTYNFSDTGTVAVLSIDSSYILNGKGEGAGEATGNSNGDFTSIEFYEPVAFTISIIASTNGATFNGDTGAGISGFGGPGGPLNGNYFQSGTLNANEIYLITEAYGLSNTDAGTSTSGSGYNDLQFTFTAIPEPSSAMMLFGSAVLLLKRPMRWTNVGLSER